MLVSQLDGNAPSESVWSQPPSMVLGDTLVLELQSFRSQKTKAQNSCGHLRSDGKKTDITPVSSANSKDNNNSARPSLFTAKKFDEIKTVFCH